jgi:hypothetical protein
MMRLFLRERAANLSLYDPLLAQELLADRIQPPPVATP